MKNYELIAELMKLPAGYDIAFTVQVTKEDMEKEDRILAGGTVREYEVNEDEGTIEFSC